VVYTGDNQTVHHATLEDISLGGKGCTMTPKFLRGEAARYREMARTIDRARSKLRLVTVAKAYEALAKDAERNRDDMIESNPDAVAYQSGA
jgi:hypothetical protein